MKFKKLLKPALIAVVLASTFTSTAYAATGESRLTPTIKGWAPYLPSVGTIVQGRDLGSVSQIQIGDVIEVPTYLVNNMRYTFADGNKSQDMDADNNGRARAGQFSVTVGSQAVAQKVSVHWYIVSPKENFTWAPDETTFDEFNDTTKNGSWVTEWSQVDATPVNTESYNMPTEGNKSLALKVPAEAAGKRIGFIIVPESQTGDPFRGQPLKVPDINYIWEQPQPQGPGDQCDLADITDSQKLSDLTTCLIDPTDPTKPNPAPKPIDNNFKNGGGDVGTANYIVTIHYLVGTTPDPKSDPILGTRQHPHPLVNSKYYADIQVLEKNSDPDATPTYRDLNNTVTVDGNGEIDTITWSFYRDGINDSVVTGTDAAAKEQELTNNLIVETAHNGTSGRTETLTGTDGRKYFVFKTQTDNNEANTVFGNAFLTNWAWDNSAINGESSEQRTRLRVSFNYDENQ